MGGASMEQENWHGGDTGPKTHLSHVHTQRNRCMFAPSPLMGTLLCNLEGFNFCRKHLDERDSKQCRKWYLPFALTLIRTLPLYLCLFLWHMWLQSSHWGHWTGTDQPSRQWKWWLPLWSIGGEGRSIKERFYLVFQHRWNSFSIKNCSAPITNSRRCHGLLF
mgnify:CR=1 FL=1